MRCSEWREPDASAFIENQFSDRCDLNGLFQPSQDWKRQVVSPIPGAEVQNLRIGGHIASPDRSTEAFKDRGDQVIIITEKVFQSGSGGIAPNVDKSSRIRRGERMEQCRWSLIFAQCRFMRLKLVMPFSLNPLSLSFMFFSHPLILVPGSLFAFLFFFLKLLVYALEESVADDPLLHDMAPSFPSVFRVEGLSEKIARRRSVGRNHRLFQAPLAIVRRFSAEETILTP